MKFVEVTELPETKPNKKGRYRLTLNELNKFMAMNVKMAKVIMDDTYTNPVSCYSALQNAAKNHVLPIDVKMRQYEVYLIRRDI